MEQGPYNWPNGWQLLIITQSRTQLKRLSSSSRMAAFGKSVSSPAFVFHWFVLQFVSLIWKMLTLASTELKKQKNFFHTSWEEEGDKTLEPRWSGNSVCKEQLRARRGVITVVWLDGSRILHCHLRQGPLVIWGAPGKPLCSRNISLKDKGAWQAIVHGSQRVRHDWATIILSLRDSVSGETLHFTSPLKSLYRNSVTTSKERQTKHNSQASGTHELSSWCFVQPKKGVLSHVGELDKPD